MFIDARIPVYFLDTGAVSTIPGPARADHVLILSGEAPGRDGRPPPASEQGWAAVLRLPCQAVQTMRHAPGCACCQGRAPQAAPLTGLFQARARGEVGFFRALVAILPGQEAAALRDALVADPFLSGCFVQAGRTGCQQHSMKYGSIQK